MKILRCCLLAVLLFSLCQVGSASAQTATGLVMTAEAGFDGYCKQGAWIPVWVTLENQGADLDGRVETTLTGNSGDRITYAYPLNLPGVSRKEITLYLFPEGYQIEIELAFVAAGITVAKATARIDCLSSTDLLFGALVDNTTAYNSLVDLDPPNGTASLARLELAQLPDHANALRAFDALIVSGLDTGELSESQQRALSGWIADGGVLLVVGGPGWQKTSAGINNLLPFIPSGAHSTPNISALQELAATTATLEGETVVATGELTAGAQVLASQGGIPLVITRKQGFGKVIYLAADPALAPLRMWDGLTTFYGNLLFAGQVEKPGWAAGIQDWYSAEQAANTLPSLSMPSGFLICGFLLVYVISIGPLTYFLLRKYKRGEFAWLSIPALILLFSGIVFILGGLVRGNKPVLNRMVVLRANADSDQVAVEGVIGVFSPSRMTYRMIFGDGLLAHSMPNATRNAGDWEFEQSDVGTSVPRLWVDVGGMRTAVFDGQMTAPSVSGSLTMTVQGDGILLYGNIFNQSKVKLRDVSLLVPGDRLALGDLAPGEARAISIQIKTAGQIGQPRKNYPIVVPVAPGIVFYSGYDATIQDIVGTGNYYNNRDAYRRYSLVAAMLNSSAGNSGRGGGIYLSAWSDEFPLDIRLEGGRKNEYDTVDTALYLVTLSPRLELGKERLVIPPGLYSWMVLEASQYDGTVAPYNANITSGGYALQFKLAHEIPYRSVSALILHLRSGSLTSKIGLTISLYDFQVEKWVEMPILYWGDFTVPDAPLYVGPAGEVRLKLEHTSLGTIQIDQADFTLIVNP